MSYYDTSYPPSLWGAGVPDPTIASITPNTSAVNVPAVATISGTNFLPNSVVEIDQVNTVAVTYVDAQTLTASFTPTVAGARNVTVRNGGAGGEESNTAVYTVTAAADDSPADAEPEADSDDEFGEPVYVDEVPDETAGG